MYKIADLVIDFESKFEYFKKESINFFVEEMEYDIKISCTDDEIKRQVENNNTTESNAEYLLLHKKLAEKLPYYDAFVFHSACFDIEGIGVVFTAHSGTGKTTHMRKWKGILQDRMMCVNGDKPIVRFFDDEPTTPYAYGTPWRGKEKHGRNMRTPLKHICFIERSETNFVEPMDKADAIARIFNQVYMPSDPVAVAKTMELIDRLLSCCKLWVIHCNMEDDAAKIAYETIFNA